MWKNNFWAHFPDIRFWIVGFIEIESLKCLTIRVIVVIVV